MAGAFASGLTPEQLRLIGAEASDIGQVGSTGSTLPDYGLGPVSDATRAGEIQGDLRAAPSPEDKLAAFADLNPLPVLGRAYKGAFDNTTDSVAEAMRDPSLLNVAAAGAKTGALAGSPALALGSAGVGYGSAALEQLSNALFPSADAGSKAKTRAVPDGKPALDPNDPVYQKVKDDPQLLALYKQIQDETYNAGRDYPGRNGDASRHEAGARLEKLQAKLDAAQGQREDVKQSAYKQQVAEAAALRDAKLGEDTSFEKTPIGKAYSKIGVAPFVLGLGSGALTSLAKGAPEGLWSELASPMMAGAALTGGGANIAPAIYNHAYAPMENKEKAAWNAYSDFLPDGHPDKERAKTYAAGLDQINPVYKQAAEEYTPGVMAGKFVGGALEAASGHEAGRYITPAIGGLFRRESWGFAPKDVSALDGAVPGLSSQRIEPTFAAIPKATRARKAATPKPDAPEPAPVAATPPPLPRENAAATPTPKGFSAPDLLAGSGKVSKAIDKGVATISKEDTKAAIDHVMRTAMKGTKRSDVAALFKASPDLTPAEATRQITLKMLELKKSPGAYSAGLDAKFNKGK